MRYPLTPLHPVESTLTRIGAPTTRRRALTQLAVLPLGVVIPAVLVACSKEPKCTDTGSLSADDAKLRTEVAAYVEPSPDVTKRCSACVQFNPGAKDACGTCKVVKGPINPHGTCKLFAAKPAT